MAAIFSYAMGLSADCLLAFMDQLLSTVENHEKERVEENMIKLIDLYYYALDAPKKGGKKVSSVCPDSITSLVIFRSIMEVSGIPILG